MSLTSTFAAARERLRPAVLIVAAGALPLGAAFWLARQPESSAGEAAGRLLVGVAAGLAAAAIEAARRRMPRPERSGWGLIEAAMAVTSVSKLVYLQPQAISHPPTVVVALSGITAGGLSLAGLFLLTMQRVARLRIASYLVDAV